MVSNVGIYVNNITYSHEELGAYVGERVIVRYNANDPESIMVYTSGGVQVCRAYTVEKLNPTADKDDEVLIEHLKSQKRQYRRAKEEIEWLQTPYAERGLMLPELSEEKQRVMAIPSDRQFKDSVSKNAAKDRKNAKKEQKDNSFMREKAQKAFERIG